MDKRTEIATCFSRNLSLERSSFRSQVRGERMKFLEFVETHCEKGTTDEEQNLYWYYYLLGKITQAQAYRSGFAEVEE